MKSICVQVGAVHLLRAAGLKSKIFCGCWCWQNLKNWRINTVKHIFLDLRTTKKKYFDDFQPSNTLWRLLTVSPGVQWSLRGTSTPIRLVYMMTEDINTDRLLRTVFRVIRTSDITNRLKDRCSCRLWTACFASLVFTLRLIAWWYFHRKNWI